MSTRIQWTDETWNPTVGCSRVSPGCDNCYAIRVAAREMQPAHVGLTEVAFRPAISPKSDGSALDWTGEVRLLPDRLNTPLRWRKPRRVFVDSMSDLFHPDVPEDYIVKVFGVMVAAGRHTYQVLTKRPQRMAALVGSDDFRRAVEDEVHEAHGTHMFAGWPYPSIWLGTSVENQRYADLRIPHLLATPAAVRFLSVEPLLGPIDLRPWLRRINDEARAASEYEWTRDRIDWVIVGGESGPGARPMHPDWVRAIRDECQIWGVPFFFKQWGRWGSRDDCPITPRAGQWVYPDGTTSTGVLSNGSDGVEAMFPYVGHSAGRLLDGRTWDEYPR